MSAWTTGGPLQINKAIVAYRAYCIRIGRNVEQVRLRSEIRFDKYDLRADLARRAHSFREWIGGLDGHIDELILGIAIVEQNGNFGQARYRSLIRLLQRRRQLHGNDLRLLSQQRMPNRRGKLHAPRQNRQKTQIAACQRLWIKGREHTSSLLPRVSVELRSESTRARRTRLPSPVSSRTGRR